MKNNILKKVMTAMVLTTSLISGAAMADSPIFGENRDYQAVVVDTVTAAVSYGPQSHSYSENGNYTAAPAWTQN